MTGLSYILLKKSQKNEAKAKSMLAFFDWAYRNGSETARDLRYVSIPASLIDPIRDMWSREIHCKGQPVWRLQDMTSRPANGEGAERPSSERATTEPPGNR